MRRIILCLGLFGLVMTSARLASSLPRESEGDQSKIMEFETMVGVSGPFVGTRNPIRGIPGAGAAWKIASAQGELETDGSLKVQVRGLVLVRTGTNPALKFRAIVGCRTIDGMGQPGIANVNTGDFPATPEGDSEIESMLELPKPCIAPIIFVTNPEGRWFAVTGH